MRQRKGRVWRCHGAGVNVRLQIWEHAVSVLEHSGVLSELVYLKEALCSATMQRSTLIHFINVSRSLECIRTPLPKRLFLLTQNPLSDFNETLRKSRKFPYKHFEIKITLEIYLCARVSDSFWKAVGSINQKLRWADLKLTSFTVPSFDFIIKKLQWWSAFNLEN